MTDCTNPILLDLFACQGGASRGYAAAGFDVVGVDLWQEHNRARYPYPSHQADAIDVLDALLDGEVLPFLSGPQHVIDVGTIRWVGLEDLAGAAASPPCQLYSITNAGQRDYPDLIGPVRDRLRATGLPYVIENVVLAPLEDPTLLCGCMFDLAAPDADGTPLRLQRRRIFESNLDLEAPRACRCAGNPRRQVAGVYGGSRRAVRLPDESLAEVAPRDRYVARVERRGGYVPRSKAVAEALLGLEGAGMTWGGLYQSIPPAYTKHLGRQVLAHLDVEAATR